MSKKTRNILIIAAAILLVSAVVVGAILLFGDDEPDGPVTIPGITPDYPAPPLDQGAEDVEDNEDKLDAPEGGGAVGMIYSNEVEIDLSDKKATLLFANPNRSTHNVAIQIVVQDVVLAESGLLTPAKRITSLDVKDGIDMPVGVYASNAKIVVRFYDPETNACSIVNSEIAITLTIRE